MVNPTWRELTIHILYVTFGDQLHRDFLRICYKDFKNFLFGNCKMGENLVLLNSTSLLGFENPQVSYLHTDTNFFNYTRRWQCEILNNESSNMRYL